jgi:predicted enzyme related to lactoylglutathione lyase
MSKIVHIEIPAPDLEKAAEFYSKVFGWKVDMEPEMDYALWSPGEEGVGGGFAKSDKPATEGVLLHIGVEDIEAKLREIEAAGGKTVTSKTKISDEYGYYAEFTDVFGNKLGLWSEE